MTTDRRIIAWDNEPVLELVPLDRPAQPRTPGSGKGQIVYMASDFDATPEEFRDYT